MDILIIILIIFIAIVAGFIGTLIGIGGGVFIVPFLTFIVGLQIQSAIAISIVSIIVTSLTGSINYVEKNFVNMDIATLLLPTTILGGIIGAFLTTKIFDKTYIEYFFGSLLLYLIYIMLRGQNSEYPVKNEMVHGNHSFFDKSTGRKIIYMPINRGKGSAVGLFTGVVSGLLGVGGGAINVPVMTKLMNMPLKVATATSVFMIGFTALGSAFIYFKSSYFMSEIAGLVIIGIFIGSYAGRGLLGKIPVTTLKRIFCIVLFIISMSMFLRAGGIL